MSPVVLSVPHAGRDYPLPLRAALRVPLHSLLPLEDRHADTLALAARGSETMLVATRPRAWIDLNRAEHERDHRIDEGAEPVPEALETGARRFGDWLRLRALPTWATLGQSSDGFFAELIALDGRPVGGQQGPA